MDERTSAEHRTAEGSDHSGAATPPATAIPEVGTIADVVCVMIEDREQREKEIAEERRRHDRERAEECRHYEEESERRIRDMTKQLGLLREMVTARPIAAPIGAQMEREFVKLTRLSNNDDIEAYITTFERMMEAYEMEEAQWPYKLAPQLTGKAQQAFAALSPDEAKSYSVVKAAVLRRYNINEETYRKRSEVSHSSQERHRGSL